MRIDERENLPQIVDIYRSTITSQSMMRMWMLCSDLMILELNI